MIREGKPVMIAWVSPEGIDVTHLDRKPIDAIELRCAGAGWRWHDFDGNEWGSAGAAINDEIVPRWVKKEI